MGESRQMNTARTLDKVKWNRFLFFCTFLLIYARSSSTLRQGGDQALYQGQVSTQTPAQSSDQEIALDASIGDKIAIYLVHLRADGSDIQLLTNMQAHDIDPAWSPDGKSIVFASDRDGGDGQF